MEAGVFISHPNRRADARHSGNNVQDCYAELRHGSVSLGGPRGLGVLQKKKHGAQAPSVWRHLG